MTKDDVLFGYRRHLFAEAGRTSVSAACVGPSGCTTRTTINGWAYSAICTSSTERTAALDGWLWHYHHRRRRSALGHQPHITRLSNLLRTYSRGPAGRTRSVGTGDATPLSRFWPAWENV
jgi:hypothetical protein